MNSVDMSDFSPEEQQELAILKLKGICVECMCNLDAHNWMCPTQYTQQQEMFDKYGNVICQ